MIDIYNMRTKRIGLEKPDDIKDVLKKEIFEFMKDNDLSQYGVAKLLGCPPSYIIQTLGSTKPVSFSKLCEIASTIGMKLTLLIEKK
ncbi:MAG: hypothetical protein JWQ35_1915 [Bacteriovoracaceae bacterium]|nr:hypothetical protein [Bacteriovoracaceae bacterium]